MARVFLRDAKARVDEELGEEAKDVDWASLDPRRYDPRRIVRDALLDDPPRSGPSGDPARRRARVATRPRRPCAGERAAAVPVVAGPPPFDDEAT